MTAKASSPNNRPATRLFFTGLTMGLVDLVPGVSGGTIAFLFGIYDELLYSIKVVTGKVPKLILKGRLKEAFHTVPFGFLLPLAIGMLTAIFGLVHIISYLLEAFPIYLWALFFGLVLGSAYIVSKRITQWNGNRILLFLAGFIGTFLLLGLPALAGSESAFALFSTGAVAIIAMILPGISGSLIMVILGQYPIVINAIAERNIVQLFPFAIGIVVGIALFARALSWLLHNHHAGTIAVLVGILLGSLRRVWPWQEQQSDGSFINALPEPTIATIFAVALMIIGFVIVWQLEKIGLTKEHDDIKDKEFQHEVGNTKD